MRPAAGHHHLGTPLAQPRPIQVEVGAAGVPMAVTPRGRRPRAVTEIQETWRVDEGWWRPQPVSRLYFALVLDQGDHLTIYRDLLGGGWWAQRY
ncbi:MAG TPA: hypothetical protein VE152_02525 [Acidimicrobiales bacterium]|nr:hypothetical protein [Acidimicrobiales bacterium]